MLRLLVGRLVAVNAQQHNVVAAVALQVLGEVPPVAGRHHLQENIWWSTAALLRPVLLLMLLLHETHAAATCDTAANSKVKTGQGRPHEAMVHLIAQKVAALSTPHTSVLFAGKVVCI